MKRFTVLLLLGLLFITHAAGCNRKDAQERNTAGDRLKVVTTLFPLYDFARIIAGEKADVTLLMPPGVEPHGFEPKPDDLVRISKAGLFIYTNRYMEPWADKIIKGLEGGKSRVVNAGAGVDYHTALQDKENPAHDHGHGHEDTAGLDPHIWLDFHNASRMVDNIEAGFSAAAPADAAYFKKNASLLKSKLVELDKSYRKRLSSCSNRSLLHGGHYTFGYLARRYALDYHSLSGISSESEPSAAGMAAMVRQIKKSGTHYLFAEELLSPRLTEILASEAGVEVLKLNGAHNLGRDDFNKGVTFIGLMESNLAVLQKGLGCQAE